MAKRIKRSYYVTVCLRGTHEAYGYTGYARSAGDAVSRVFRVIEFSDTDCFVVTVAERDSIPIYRRDNA